MSPKYKHEAVAWAKAYPFDVPARSFIYVDGESHDVTRLTGGGWTSAHIDHAGDEKHILSHLREQDLDIAANDAPRVAVIASGSNASPQRLAQKFSDALPGAVVPTLRVRLQNYCVVYSAKFCSYGSMPATLTSAPGAEVEVFVNLLTEDQLEVMDATETLGIEYHRPVLDGAQVVLEDESVVTDVQAYISLHGALAPQGSPYALDTIKGRNVPFAPMHQEDVQSMVHALFDHEGPLDEFIYENISDAELRRKRSEHLKENHGIPAVRSDSERVST